MPIYKGTNNIVAIYKGTNLIGSVYKGTNLVYSSEKAYHSNTTGSIVTLYDSSGNQQYIKASGTAVAGTQYYSWNISTRLFQTVSVAEGADVSNYYTLNSSFVLSNTVGVYAFNYGDIPNGTTQLILGQMQYGNNWYDICSGPTSWDIYTYQLSSITEIIFYNVFKYQAEQSDLIITPILIRQSTSLSGYQTLRYCSKITVINSYIAFRPDGDTTSPTIGQNVAVGTDLIFKNCKFILDNFAGNTYTNWVRAETFIKSGLYKIKSININCPNLLYIGNYALTDSTYNNATKLSVDIPQSVRYIGADNFSLASSGTSDEDLTFNIKNSNLKWYAKISGTIPNDTYGLACAGYSYTGASILNKPTTFTSYDLPSTLQCLSSGALYTSSAKTFKFNNNILPPPREIPSVATSPYRVVSDDYAHTFDFASNVTSIPENVFKELSSISKIYIRCPNGTPVDIAYRAFYYKSSRSVSIYTDNQSVKDYNWSSNQNISPTFYHLDGTAWS